MLQSILFAATYNNYQPVPLGGLVQYGAVGAVLTDGNGLAVVDTNSNDYQQYPQYQNGVMSGVLFVNLSDALCPGNPSPAAYCANQANSASVYYVWQTGPASYSQFAALKFSYLGDHLIKKAPIVRDHYDTIRIAAQEIL